MEALSLSLSLLRARCISSSSPSRPGLLNCSFLPTSESRARAAPSVTKGEADK